MLSRTECGSSVSHFFGNLYPKPTIKDIYAELSIHTKESTCVIVLHAQQLIGRRPSYYPRSPPMSTNHLQNHNWLLNKLSISAHPVHCTSSEGSRHPGKW